MDGGASQQRLRLLPAAGAYENGIWDMKGERRKAKAREGVL
jgi:hypothetical protein